MRIHRVRNQEEYNKFIIDQNKSLEAHFAKCKAVIPASREPFRVSGLSYTANKQVEFLVGFEHSATSEPNWRETVNCPETYFNNRMRATFQIIDFEMNLLSDTKIYVTEQVTPAWKWFSERFENAIGSEFLNDGTPRGATNSSGIRSEDLTNLSFEDGIFDAVVSLDVIEHIPDFIKAFRETHRILRFGGRLFWSVPFITSIYKNIIRAEIIEGKIKLLMQPEYHGDPISDEGCLCFTSFGWELLDQVRQIGFRDVYAIVIYSTEWGYYGEPQIFFTAIK